MYKIKLNKSYENFQDFLINIKEYFEANNETIHKARNELKIIKYNGIDTVVKAFKVPNTINKIAYTYLRDSKAKKSYEYSLKIGEFTPNPIGYIEFFEKNLLSNSYFVSEKFDYDFTIREPLLEENFKDREEVFKAFARFTFELHENGILHKDYSPGNILIKQNKDQYIFKIVDINRMEFRKLNLEERLLNFSQLWALDEYLTIIIKEYAALVKEDKSKCLSIALKYSQKHKDKKNFKKRLKGQKVVD